MHSTSMFGATMPEASINEDSDLGSCEDNVRLPPEAGQWSPMHEVAQAKPVQLPTKSKLGSGVPSGKTAHSLAYRLG
jgi:hypothetical protein